MMIAAIVLAAGRSTRMGRQKLLLPWKDGTVIERVVDELIGAALDQIHVVVGDDGDLVRQKLGGRCLTVTRNPAPNQGMLSSVRCGLESLRDDYRSVLVVPGDHPCLTADVVRRVAEAFDEDSAPIVVPVHRGRRGHPLLFARRFVAEVMTSYDDVGLRGLLREHPEQVHTLEVDSASVLADLDTPEDYRKMLE